jgi:hypothetical protein
MAAIFGRVLERLALPILAVVILCPVSRAATYYVAGAGADRNPGTLPAPWKTLRRALPALRAGDTLYVRGGTYVENLGGDAPVRIKRGKARAPILVKAYPGERPILQGLLWLSRPSYWTLDGLNVTWKRGNQPSWHMVKLVNGVGWTVKNAEIWGARSYAGILVAGTTRGKPANWTLAHNTIHDTYPTNDTNQDHLIYAYTGLAAGPGLIERNLLYNAENGEGIKLAGARKDQGTAYVTVRYNTIYNTSQSILVGGRSHHNTIYRNLLCRTKPRNGCIRGYRLTGTDNAAHDNLGTEAACLLDNDAEYDRIRDGGGNRFGVDPQFDFVGPGGLKPKNPEAADYGVYANGNEP